MSGAEYASYDVCETVALLDWIQAGYVRPLEDLPGFDEVKERCVSGSVDYFTFPGPDGKTHTWAIPFYTSCQLFYYRTDLLEKAGYSKPPRTYDELLEYSKALTKGGVYGYVIDWADDNFVYRFAERMLAAGGGQLVDENSKPQWNSKAGIRALSWMRDMWQAKVVVPESINIESSGVSMNIFLQGTAAFTQNWTIVSAAMNDPNKSAIVGKAKESINLGDVLESASVASYGGLFIPKKSEKR